MENSAHIDENRDPLTVAERWLGEGRHVALATVVETWGSAPRRAGSHLVIDAEGNFQGSVSGGCVEGAVVSEALETLATRQAEDARIRGRRRDGVAGRPVMRRPHQGLCRAAGRLTMDASLPESAERRTPRPPGGDRPHRPDGRQRPHRPRRRPRPGGARRSRLEMLPDRQLGGRRGRRAGLLPQCAPAAAAARSDRGGAYQPGAGADGADSGISRRDHRPADRLRDTRAVSRRDAPCGMARRRAEKAAARPLHRTRRGHPRSEDRRFSPAGRTRRRLLLRRRARQPKDAWQACGAAAALGTPAEAIARIHAPIGLEIGAASPAEIAVAVLAQVISEFRSRGVDAERSGEAA